MGWMYEVSVGLLMMIERQIECRERESSILS